MRLATGTRLGAYEISGPIGAGAMGEVYRARDHTLGRDVALKVLPATLAADPERLARLKREAQALASLNHPNVAQIYGFETASSIEAQGDVHALVLELVNGPTLADRIATGPLELGEAMKIARQITSALAAAHDAGIVHRDLKPANIKVREDGTVKILDFGLAKGGQPGWLQQDSSSSPTMTAPALGSEAGVILGTASYMSPEQARGKNVDMRSDIWAFGVVLAEMVTGRRLFDGETISDTIAAVLTREPTLDDVPPSFGRLVRCCVVKDPAARLRHIGDAMALVDDPSTASERARSSRKPVWAAVVIACLAVAAAAWAIWRSTRASQPDAAANTFSIEAPPGGAFNYTYSGTAVSPDGRQIVFRVATATGAPALWLRPLDSLAARPIPGTELGDFPFWSADGRSIAFFATGRLKRVELATGAPIVVSDASDTDTGTTGGSWNQDGAIIFGAPQGLYRVSASGGTPALIAPINAAAKETGYGFPQFLPDGDRFLIFVRSSDRAHEGVYASSLSHPDRKTLVLATDRKAMFVARERGSGYLVYLQERTLLARRMDNKTLTLTGDPKPIAANVALFPPGYHASFWVSASATVLAYRTEASDRPRLTWVDADRKRQSVTGTEDFYTHLRLSPDGTRAALELTEGGGNTDVWTLDFSRRMKTRQTFDPGADRFPVWSPDSREISFSSRRTGVLQIYRKGVDNGQPEQGLTTGPDDKIVLDWSHDGRYLFFVQKSATTSEDIWALPLVGEGKPFPVLMTMAIDSSPALSPDGRWLAFESPQSGRPEVYVMKFSGSETKDGEPGRRWQVSSNGGSAPRWSGDGRALFYVSLDDQAIMRSEVRAVGNGLQSDTAQVFAEIAVMPVARSPFDVSSDGRRVLLLERTINQAVPLIIDTNWMAGSAEQ